MDTINKKQLLERVLEYKNKYSIDVIKLANGLGINIFHNSDIKKSAQISYDESDGSVKILVRKDEPFTRQRFSVAHELAHYVLHADILKTNGSLHRNVKKVSEDIEKEADKLSAEILMPDSLVKSFIKKNRIDVSKIDKVDVQNISDSFKVSNYVTAIRLRDMDYYVPYIEFS